jgi:probable rRNA maturation factor
VPLLLGDIMLCPAVAERQAVKHRGDYETEIALLLVHGVLHLLGHDHAEPAEEAVMKERERFHLARHGKVASREDRS